jgi:hypothetical protein
MRIYVTRDSVCAGDDGDAPHVREFDLPGSADVSAAVEHVLGSGYLPSISGGQATWSITSAIPVAIAAQQWAKAKHFHLYGGLRDVDFASGTLRLHCNYHAQIEPDVVHKVLWSFRLRAV